MGPLLFSPFIADLNYSIYDYQDLLESRSQRNYLGINESKTKVPPLGDNLQYYEYFDDRTRPPLGAIHDMKLLGPTVDGSLSFKPTLNLYIIK